MDRNNWRVGLLFAVASAVCSPFTPVKDISVYCALLCIGFWLEGIAQVIKEKK